MLIVYNIQLWLDRVLWIGLLALQAWAIADCASRKAAAFPAVDRLTKPSWLAILIVAAALTVLVGSAVNIIAMIAAVAASVYLADVRPAIKEITGGKRW
ncbi:Protein of unknown function [Frankineae bacterium MT45]|uniref:DUF2516 family protein n=1 Tax=Jatrophihabitans sp. GAS493 TaxID=1907575 RepID=UPI00087AAA22|nr:DUF2516 family protein [Jatrophihabitans sp. GAS493]SDI92057.1 Protein of unknown function [Frankineae bacterium MT45]SOD70719.1 uncharacterized protein DUF2516 [Jatrophihabitans sp. GAS493]